MHFLFFLLFFANIAAAEPSKLTVSGSATVTKPANLLTFNVGVISQDSDLQKAIQANKEKMARVMQAIVKIGFSKDEFQTGNFYITPKYAPAPKMIPPNWHPAIVGYEVHNSLTIKTEKLELAGPAIDRVVAEGANSVDELNFTLKDVQEAKSEAIARAVAEARHYADIAAKEAGIGLSNILELNIDQTSFAPRTMKYAMAAETTPITPGNVEVSSNVTIHYEIQNAGTP